MDDKFFTDHTVEFPDCTIHITHKFGKLTPEQIREGFKQTLIDGAIRRQKEREAKWVE